MAPAVILDTADDFQIPIKTTDKRTLLLAPPCVSSHPEALAGVSAAYDRSHSDIQMLDRLAMGLVELPAATYDVVLLLTEVAGAAEESTQLLNRDVMGRIFAAMKAGGTMQSQDGTFGRIQSAPERTEAILAGLVQNSTGEGMVKPESAAAGQTVSLKFGKKKANAAAVPANDVERASVAKRKNDEISNSDGVMAQANGSGPVKATLAGVGFINTDDDLDLDSEEDDKFPSNEELERAGKIDPDTLLTEADRQRPIIIPEACKPNSKRRRACKDCSCGLAQRIAEEDQALRANADANLAKLSATDLNEVDFTVKGKVGSCGNCALGDAFRCDGCPYIGLPAFKPGEEVRLLSNDVQL